MSIRYQDHPLYNGQWRISDEARERESKLYREFMEKYREEVWKVRRGEVGTFDVKDVLIKKST